MAPLFPGCAEGSFFPGESPSGAPHRRWRRQFVVPPGLRVEPLCGLVGTTEATTLLPAHSETTLRRLARIFILRCDRHGHAELLSYSSSIHPEAPRNLARRPP